MMADASEIKVLNLVGSRIFELADGTRKVSDIVAQISLEYEVSETEARRDVHEFLIQLTRENILVLADEEEQNS